MRIEYKSLISWMYTIHWIINYTLTFRRHQSSWLCLSFRCYKAYCDVMNASFVEFLSIATYSTPAVLFVICSKNFHCDSSDSLLFRFIIIQVLFVNWFRFTMTLGLPRTWYQERLLLFYISTTNRVDIYFKKWIIFGRRRFLWTKATFIKKTFSEKRVNCLRCFL